ncbi:hypothetical protein K438DRAFT_1785334 [Mycena galopus ATCC 62051]|nr:hypothetical protein K438DRAFT_1785334 [Mycena galopus ATCC 62051]
MPLLPTAIEIRIENIMTSLTPAMLLLTELNDAFGPPFVQSIANTIQSLISMVQLMEPIHRIVYGIVNLHIKSETVGFLSPSMLDNIGTFMGTLHKIYVYIETQQEGNKIKNLFRSSEIKQLLQDCHAGLNQAIEVFNTKTGAEIFNDVREFKNKADLMHKELIKLIETLSDTGTISERGSATKPKIFHGREQELEDVLNLLSEKSPRIAILGGGGMGKTSLARAALHHPDIASKFKHRFFVSAEAATTSIELAALVGLHLGLNSGQDLTKAVVRYLARTPASLLILDNLETVWEDIQTRAGVENLLSLLSEVEHLALIITMRGAERPAQVQWTHPCLGPLQPLSNGAATQTFMDITDSTYSIDEVDQILQFTGNMPLAVDLIAHLTDYEGLQNVLSRWELERTSMLSAGFYRQSCLDTSISLSLSSPRITPGSKELLSLLSILPNGLSDAELMDTQLGIANICSCKAVLQATSLAYHDRNKRLLLLMPIREYIQRFLPPSESRIQLIRSHFYALLNLYKKYDGPQLQPVVNQITLNLANVHEVLKQGLYPKAPTLGDTIHCVLSLNSFRRVTVDGHTPLMNDLQGLLPELCDHKLKICFLLEVLYSQQHWTLVTQEALSEARDHLMHINDPVLQATFYRTVGVYFLRHKRDFQGATEFLQHALKLSEQCGDINGQCSVLVEISPLQHAMGLYAAAQDHARMAQKLARLSGNVYEGAKANWVGARCSLALGKYQESAEQLERARKLLRICGMLGGVIDRGVTIEQAEIHLLKSEYTQCRSIHSNLVENTSSQENPIFHATALLNIAIIDIIIGVASHDVYHNLRRGQEIFRNENYAKRTLSMCDAVQGSIELRDGKFNTARDKFEKYLCLPSGMDNELQCFCLDHLANIKCWPADGWQHKWPAIYLAFAYKSKDKLTLHKALLFLGDICVIHHDEHTATNLYQVALAGFTQMDVHHSRAQCMLRLGDLAHKQGCISDAAAFWTAARPLFSRSSQPKDVAEIDFKLARIEQVYQENLMALGTLNAPVHLVRDDK